MTKPGTGRWAWLRSGRWEPYAWLVYSVPFLVFAFNHRLAWWQSALMLASYPVFLAMYIGGQRVRGLRALWLVAGLDALGAAFSSINPAAASFFIYGSAMLGHVRPFRHAVAGLVAQGLLGGVTAFALGSELWYWFSVTVLSLLIGGVTIQAAVSAEHDGTLRMAHDEIRRLAQLAERERIARDLHDVLGHTLSVIVLKSELAGKLATRDPAHAAQEMAEVESIARAGLAEVRHAIAGYRAAGLPAEVEHARQLLMAAGVETTIDVAPVSLDTERDTALSLALREAATNVIRHAEATACRIRVLVESGAVCMTVADNGRGQDAPFGSGLTGMRERLDALGGRLVRETGAGTRLTITVPLARATVGPDASAAVDKRA